MARQQQEAAQKAAEAKAKFEARSLEEEELKGKVDVRWFGHAAFKISFKDADNEQRNIYIDFWADNKDCPEEVKTNPPNDADLVLVTHG